MNRLNYRSKRSLGVSSKDATEKMNSLNRQLGSHFRSPLKRAAAIIALIPMGLCGGSLQAQSPVVQIDGKAYPVATFVGPVTKPPATQQPATQQPATSSADTQSIIAETTAPESIVSEPAVAKPTLAEPLQTLIPIVDATVQAPSNELPKPTPKAQPQSLLPTSQPTRDSDRFEFDIVELAPSSREMLDDYASMPEVSFELIREMFAQSTPTLPANQPAPFSLASHSLDGLGLTEVNTEFAIDQGSQRSTNNPLANSQSAPSTQSLNAEREKQAVATLLRSLNSPQPNLLQMHSIDVPQWLGQIQFAMLRYGSHTDLTLEDAIYTAIQYSPEIEILRADVTISQAEITKQQAGFDWSNFIQSNWDERNVPVASNLDGAFNRLENHTLANKLGITKRTTRGGNVTLGQDLGFADSNSTFFNPLNQANSQIALEYQQPLLQGAGLLTNYSRINIAVANAAVTQEQFVAGLQAQILNVIQAYWDLAAARGEFVVLKRSYDRALETATVVSNRVQLDVGPVQSARSEATLGARRAALLRSEFTVVLAQEKLLRLMFGQYFRDSVNTEVIPTSNMLGPSREVDMDLELQLGLQCRPEVRESLQVIKRTSIEQGVARNQLLPLLGLTMSVSNRGLRGNNGLASAFNDQFSFGDPTYGVGVAYELPVGNRAAKANLRQAQVRLVRFQKEFETVVSNVALEVRNACHNIANATQQREATGQAMALVDRELNVLKSRAELLLDGDNVGPLYLDDLLTTQERLADAELAFLNASTAHALSYFELQRANGSLLRATPVAGISP